MLIYSQHLVDIKHIEISVQKYFNILLKCIHLIKYIELILLL